MVARLGYWLRSGVGQCHLRLRGKLGSYVDWWVIRVLIQLLVSLRHLVIVRHSELRLSRWLRLGRESVGHWSSSHGWDGHFIGFWSSFQGRL